MIHKLVWNYGIKCYVGIQPCNDKWLDPNSALIDSDATQNSVPPARVTKCGLSVETHDTFLELGDGTKVLSWG